MNTNLGSKRDSLTCVLESRKCSSTNQFASDIKAFHKSPNTLNYKNFSQIKIGHNGNIESFYKNYFDGQKDERRDSSAGHSHSIT
jgi:hypothetical protein